MTDGARADRMVMLCKSLFDRGYSVGGAGNVSVRSSTGGFIVTPTGSSLGRLRADALSMIAADGVPLPGPKPSKEFAFHRALYDVRPQAGAIVHLHSTYLTALSCLDGVPRDNAIRPFTPYYVMRIGRMPVIPYSRPGSPQIGRDLAQAAADGRCQAFLLASHGVVVLGRDIDDAVNNAEELEETAKLHFILRGERLRYLTDDQIADLGRGY